MLRVYSILDKVANSWLTVSLFNNDDVAKRAFVDLLNSSGFNPHKEDYAIYYIADFDSALENDGNYISPLCGVPDPILVFDGADLVKESFDE